jgi:hypothetical protein
MSTNLPFGARKLVNCPTAELSRNVIACGLTPTVGG